MKKIVQLILIIILNGTSSAQNIIEVKTSDCDRNSYPQYLHNTRLISKTNIDDTLILKLGIVRNCEFDPVINCWINADSLILNIENVATSRAACICCFEIELTIAKVKDTNLTCFIGEKEIHILNNKYIFTSLTEINQVQEVNQLNNDSLKIGLWNIYSDKSIRVKGKAYYFIDEFGKSRLKWRVLYNQEGELSEICALANIDIDGNFDLTCTEGNQYLSLEIK